MLKLNLVAILVTHVAVHFAALRVEDDQEGQQADEPLAGQDDEAGGQGQLGPEASEHRGEGRDDLPQDDRDDDARDPDDRDGIDHGALHLRRELHRLLDVGGEALQDGVEDTARLAGGDHVHVELGERGAAARAHTHANALRGGGALAAVPPLVGAACRGRPGL